MRAVGAPAMMSPLTQESCKRWAGRRRTFSVGASEYIIFKGPGAWGKVYLRIGQRKAHDIVGGHAKRAI